MSKKKDKRARAFKGRDMNPSNGANWKLVCSLCGAEFAMVETVDLADGHYQQDHPGEKIAFNTLWQGVGPPPKGRK
jgi:hypothetical protein